MKKKILSVLLSFVSIFVCAFSMTLASCGHTKGDGSQEEISDESGSVPPWNMGEMPIE